MNKHFLQIMVRNQAASATQGGEVAEAEKHPFPSVVALPRELVAHLEDAALGELDGDLCLQWLRGLHQKLDRLSRYTLHRAEELCLTEALNSCRQIEHHLSNGDVFQATEEALILFRALTRFEIQRESNRQSKLHGVNEFLVAGLSYLENRTEGPIVQHFLGFAISDIDHMVSLYKQVEEHLPSEVQQAFLTGIERASKGVEIMQAWDGQSKSQLKSALSQVTDGSNLLATLQKWKEENDTAAQGSVPVLGHVVQEYLGLLGSEGRLRKALLDEWHEDVFPQLSSFWAEARGSLLVETKVREPVIAEIDQTMELLSQLEDLAPHQQQTALQDLDSHFHLVSNNQMDLGKLEKLPRRWVADLMIAIAAGGIPLFYLERAKKDLEENGGTKMAQALDMYLGTGDTDLILTLLEEQLK